MSHWAEVKEVDGKKIVQRVFVGNNNDADEGYAFLVEKLGGEWVKTSFNGTIRKRFAGQGMEWREDLDAFIVPQPYPSWTLNEETADWEAPVPKPDGAFKWDEATLAWVEIEPPVAPTV